MSVFNAHLHDHLQQSFTWKALPEQQLPRVYQTLRLRLAEWKYRRALVKLTDYNDAILDDMGLTRGDLLNAIELPLAKSARKALAQWKAERRITG